VPSSFRRHEARLRRGGLRAGALVPLLERRPLPPDLAALNILRVEQANSARALAQAHLRQPGARRRTLFIETDCSIVEVNPLVITQDDKAIALDAKINFDDNALPRHPEFIEWRDPSSESKEERAAREKDLSYISLDGNIGCMVNGAGLAMATMDLIKLHGGNPANFLDVGGGATAERVTAAFKLILANKKVRAILVNIFGGIVRCDLIAEGVMIAVKQVGVSVPVIVRLEGTNAEQAREMLAHSALAITPATDLTDAARKVVSLAAGNKHS
jgi:succinyl-CoA synthetase beta subunit